MVIVVQVMAVVAVEQAVGQMVRLHQQEVAPVVAVVVAAEEEEQGLALVLLAEVVLKR